MNVIPNMKKVLSVEEAAEVIKSNHTIYGSNSASMPTDLLIAIGNRYKELENVNIWGTRLTYPYEFIKNPDCKSHINYHSIFMGPLERKYFENIDVTSLNVSRLDWFMSNRIKPDVYCTEVSPPDENGNMSLGPAGNAIGRSAADYAETIIALVNPNVPFVYGNYLNVNEVTYICESRRELPLSAQSPATEVEKKIADHIIPYIHDGATIQIGLGGVANCIVFGLENHKDLGVHSDMFSDSMRMIAEKGVITGKKKTADKGIIITSAAYGTQELYDYVHRNEMIKAVSTTYLNHPAILAQQHDFVSINSCMMCDLTGQICSESIGFDMFSGTGGQLDYVLGASLANALSFLCMHSTAKMKDGTLISRIHCALPPGSIVTTPRSLVHCIVTEYGVADIRDKSIKQRVEAVIKVAHPNFRHQLLKEAKKNRLIV